MRNDCIDHIRIKLKFMQTYNKYGYSFTFRAMIKKGFIFEQS